VRAAAAAERLSAQVPAGSRRSQTEEVSQIVRTIALVFVAIVSFALVATPGLPAVGLLIGLFALLAAAWWIALGRAAPARQRSEALVRVRHREFLGPGGPDDPFADEPFA
jgi:hypothetical protein